MTTTGTDRIRNLARAAASQLDELIHRAEQADKAEKQAAEALEAAHRATLTAEANAEAEAVVVAELLDAAGVDRTNRPAIAQALGWTYDDMPYNDEERRRNRIIANLRRTP